MSTEAPPLPPAAPLAPPPAPAPAAGNVLPEGIKIDHAHSADGFFERQEAVNKGEAAKPIVPPVAPVVPEVKVEEPVKGSIAAKLGKPKVPNPTATPAAAKPDDGKSFAEKLDTAPDPEPGKAGEHFKAWKGQAKHALGELQRQNTELQAQLTAAKAAPAAPLPNEEVDRLKSEHKTMSDRLLLLDVQAHPTFKTQFTEPKRQAVETAQQLLKDAQVEGVDVAALLARPRAEFGKLVAEAGAKLNDFDRVDFAEQMRKAYAITQQERDAIGRSRETLQAIQQGNTAKAQQAFSAVEQDLMAKAGEFLPQLEPADNASAEEKTAIEAYNMAVKELPAAARKLAFESGDEKAVAASAFKAAAYELHINHVLPRLMAEHDQVLQVNRRLTEEIKAIRGRNPNFERHQPLSAGDARPDPSKMSHAEAAEYFANGGARG